jgi:protein involved in polysaccharide export with SLBB domain
MCHLRVCFHLIFSAYLYMMGFFCFIACTGPFQFQSPIFKNANQNPSDLEIPQTKQLLNHASLGAGDVFEVRVYQEEELTGLYRVDQNGFFDFPLIGSIKAEGFTATQIAENIENKLSTGYLRNPQVTVFVKEFNSKKIFVLGKVQKPGPFNYEDKMSIVQAIALAGGLHPLASKEIVLIRVENGAEKRYMINFEDISQGKASNTPLNPGDILFIPESWL